MIEGMKVDYAGTDLKEHLIERRGHHEKRAAFYKKQAEEFSREASDAEIRQGQNTFQQTKKTMEEQAIRHEKALEFFRVLADHAVGDETYRLTIDDLQTLEMFGTGSYNRFY